MVFKQDMNFYITLLVPQLFQMVRGHFRKEVGWKSMVKSFLLSFNEDLFFTSTPKVRSELFKSVILFRKLN